MSWTPIRVNKSYQDPEALTPSPTQEPQAEAKGNLRRTKIEKGDARRKDPPTSKRRGRVGKMISLDKDILISNWNQKILWNGTDIGKWITDSKMMYQHTKILKCEYWFKYDVLDIQRYSMVSADAKMMYSIFKIACVQESDVVQRTD